MALKLDKDAYEFIFKSLELPTMRLLEACGR